ncbi:LppX_LprAFG lipoprotein [Nocardioides sp. W3-2-3]|nr:LppX_LprAFG lipoprotein [Nocardioides convexus]
MGAGVTTPGSWSDASAKAKKAARRHQRHRRLHLDQGRPGRQLPQGGHRHDRGRPGRLRGQGQRLGLRAARQRRPGDLGRRQGRGSTTRCWAAGATSTSRRTCALPTPRSLLDPATGVSTVLTTSKDVEAGRAERGGTDNKEIFTTYSGTATGDAIRGILPCAEGDSFDATYRVDDKGYLRSARLSGVFFPDSDEVTYSIDVTKYDVNKDISAPR